MYVHNSDGLGQEAVFSLIDKKGQWDNRLMEMTEERSLKGVITENVRMYQEADQRMPQ